MENQKILFPSMKRGIMIEMTLWDRNLAITVTSSEKGTSDLGTFPCAWDPVRYLKEDRDA